MEDRRLFVGGLKYTTTEDTIARYFSRWGEVMECKLVKYPPPDNRSKGFAFVSFDSADAKNRCYADRPHSIDEKDVDIRLSDKQGRSGSDPAANKMDLEDVKFRRLFVGNLDKDWGESVVQEYFGSLGDVEECTVKRGQQGESLGFAFMTFKSSGDVDMIQNNRPHTILNKQIETRRQVAKQNVGKPEAKLEVDRIWMGPPESEKKGRGHVGLNDEHTDEVLEEYFAQFGSVRKIQQLLWNDSGKNKKRGYGFIYFTDTDAADKVVLQQIHVVNGVKLEVKKAVQDKDKKAGTSSNKMDGGNMSTGNNMNSYNNMGNNMMNNMMGGNMYGMPPVSNLSLPPNMNSGAGGMDGGRDGRKRGFDQSNSSAGGDMSKRAKLEPRDPECTLMRSVFVGNLNPVATAKELKDFFNNYGSVVTVDLRMKKDSDRNKGFAFVIYEKAKDVDNLMSHRPVTMNGSKLDCKRKTPQGENLFMEEKVSKIWIGRPEPEYRIKSYGLDETTTDEVLREYFEQFGRVVEVYQFTWKDTNKKRGYGYITFDDSDVVDKVVLLGIHEVAGIKLQAKKALTKEVQEALEKKKTAAMMQDQDFSQNRSASDNNQSAMMMNQMSMGSNNMGQGMGYNNSMMGMNPGMSTMNPMMNMMPPMQQQQMNPMQNMQTMQTMMGQQQQAFNNPMMNQNMMNQMNQMPPMQNMNTNNQMANNAGYQGGRTAGRGSGGNQIGEMMQNMTSMMGSIKQEVGKGGGGGAKDDTADKMMGMMGNMMSMMGNMASILQQQATANTGTSGAGAAPQGVPPPTQASNNSRPSRFDNPTSSSGSGSRSQSNSGGYSNNQATSGTPNYGHTYSNTGASGSPGGYPRQGAPGSYPYGQTQTNQAPPMAPPPAPPVGTPQGYGNNWAQK